MNASELSRDGTPVPIEPQSLRLLSFLIGNRHRVVTRDDLVAEIWQGRAVSDWAVSAAIKAVRAALGDTDRPRRMLRTVHSVGFRFVADVEEEPAHAAAPQAPGSVLVRPFRAPDDAPDSRYLADGLAEDLITDLTRHGGLSVLSWRSASAIGDGPPPAAANVTAVVEGSLRQIDQVLRINVTVHDARDDRQIWAERFDLTRSSLLAAQDRISARISAILLPGAAPEDRPRDIGTKDALAYDSYLQGRHAYFRYEPAAFAEALSHFAAAAGRDPGFAEAWAQQAYCRTTLHVFGLPGADITLDPAEDLARKAIALNDGSALAHARLGWVLGFRGRPDEAVAAFAAATAREPDNAEVWYAWGETMNRLAQPAQAGPLLDRAFAGDILSPPSWEFARGHTCVLLRDTERAIAHFETVLAQVDRFIPARVQLTRALVENGAAEAAAQMVARIRQLAPAYSLDHAARMFPYPVAAERARLHDALAAAGMQASAPR